MDYSKYIIPPSDKRYYKLPYLWSRYSWDDLVKSLGKLSIYYFIPPELVIKDSYYCGGWKVLSSLDKMDSDCNWSSSKSIRNKLSNSCNLSVQDYFDLLILKINNKDDRPKCDNCGNPLEFSNRIYYGYSKTYCWISGAHNFCSKSCSAYYQATHCEEFEGGIQHQKAWLNARNNTYNKIYTDYQSFLSKGSPTDICYLYLGYLDDPDDLIAKYGVTKDISARSWMYYQSFKTIHNLLSSTRIEIANIEATLKFHFNGLESISPSEVHELINNLKIILKNRPVKSPFK